MVNAKLSRLTCVMLISCFIYNKTEPTSNKTKNQESYVFNQDTWQAFKTFQKQIINLDKTCNIVDRLKRYGYKIFSRQV